MYLFSYIQNGIAIPSLQYIDLKTRLHTARRAAINYLTNENWPKRGKVIDSKFRLTVSMPK
jgi:hypothetical protein